MRQFPRGWGSLSRSFFRGIRVRLVSYLKLTAVLLSTLSVTLLFIGVSKQNFCFHMILYLRSAECFFMAWTLVYVTRLSFAP